MHRTLLSTLLEQLTTVYLTKMTPRYKIWEGEFVPKIFPEITENEYIAVAWKTELIVELIMAHGWKLISVSSVGGCRKSHDRYHFIKEDN